uniref:Ribosomal protein S21 n=1 Tax=Kalanchoe fedtschenkoi TaxID=63787 RepID=A0A7N1A994_KALFE
MNTAAKAASNLLRRVLPVSNSLEHSHQLQQSRGIRVKVMNGNLDQALTFMQRAMTSSGIERLIKNAPTRHYKKAEKRVLAKKALERRLRSQDMARKLKSILVQKVRGV